MDYHVVLFTYAVLGAGAVASSSACTGPDPGAITFSERPGSAGDPQGVTSSGDGGSAGSGGTTDSTAPDPIFGTEAFTYVDPGVTANGVATEHQNTVEGKDCMLAGCHLDGTVTTQLLFGGTVYSTTQGTATVAKAEVRILGPDNTEVGRAYTDKNGNFWLDAQGKQIPAGSKVGVRREGGSVTRVMTPTLTSADGSCNGNRSNCHGTAATGKLYID